MPARGARLTLGEAHSCVATMAGAVLCWGANEHAQLGDEGPSVRSLPRTVAGLADVVELAAGHAHTCARTLRGEVYCWGAGLRGQLGDGEEGEAHQAVAAPARVEGIPAAAQIVAGAFYTCALGEDGTVSCWGDDAAGQLGDGDGTDRSATPVDTGLSGVAAIAAGALHTCAVTHAGAVQCWGSGVDGQLGNGQTGQEASSSFPVAVALDAAVDAVVAGRAHTCALARANDENLGGRVWCWGSGARGQLGDGHADEAHASARPVEVRELSDAVSLSAGADHTCARRASDEVWCWGANAFGQLGDGTHTDAPTPVATGVYPVEVAAGAEHTCARHDWGGVVCWGSNAAGQLGDGRVVRRARAEWVEQLTAAAGVAAGGNHTCAERESAVFCWGDNLFGELGDWTHAARSTAIPSAFLRAPQQMSLALGRTCIRDGDGTVSCLGYRPGEPDTGPQRIALGALGQVQQIAVSHDFACALGTQGAIQCWGDNDHGQLGDGTLEPRPTPSAVRGAGDAREIAVGENHACARLLSGTVMCWGANAVGQVGDGTYEDRTVPTRVDGIDDAEQLALGRSHSCVRRRDGRVSCWGGNGAGQLGDGTRTSHPTAVYVTEVAGVEEISSGWLHTCVRTATRVFCWGENRYGQLGRETEEPWGPTPALVPELTGVTQIASGGLHTCARSDAGRIACWGSNTHGQLGDGSTLMATRPVLVQLPRN